MIRHTRSITCKIIDHKIIYNIPVYFDEELMGSITNIKIVIDRMNNTLASSITDGQLCIRRRAVSVLVLGLLYKLYQIINHRRIRSNCCGKILVVAVDIDSTSTTPRQNQILPEQSYKFRASCNKSDKSTRTISQGLEIH